MCNSNFTFMTHYNISEIPFLYLSKPIFVNGVFVALCVTTILPLGPITISLFKTSEERVTLENRLDFRKMRRGGGGGGGVKAI